MHRSTEYQVSRFCPTSFARLRMNVSETNRNVNSPALRKNRPQFPHFPTAWSVIGPVGRGLISPGGGRSIGGSNGGRGGCCVPGRYQPSGGFGLGSGLLGGWYGSTPVPGQDGSFL